MGGAPPPFTLKETPPPHSRTVGVIKGGTSNLRDSLSRVGDCLSETPLELSPSSYEPIKPGTREKRVRRGADCNPQVRVPIPLS